MDLVAADGQEIDPLPFRPDLVFLALAQKQATQNELAQQMGCSQAKISMMFKFIRIRLFYELNQAGFTEMP